MALRIRMKRLGRRNRPFWRICATDKRAARDGRVVEELGHYDPHQDNEDKVKIHRDRVVHWLKHGAQPSKTVTELLGHLGLDAKGNEITPKPWPKKKKKGPPPKAAERVAAEKAAAEAAGTDQAAGAPAEAPAEDAGASPEQGEAADTPAEQAEAPEAESAPEAEADAGGEENASA